MIAFPKQPAFRASTNGLYGELVKMLYDMGYRRPSDSGYEFEWTYLNEYQLPDYWLTLSPMGQISFYSYRNGVPLNHTPLNSPRAFTDYVRRYAAQPNVHHA